MLTANEDNNMDHKLNSGTLLDGRYSIECVLGEGGFGITYCAENTRIGIKVAIKELFWRGHSSRDVETSPQVTVSRTEDEAFFRAQKERFLKEARILRDFSNLPGLAHILDYFEENGTAYIVMEYIDGVTLSRFLADHGGQMDPEILLRRMLPLMDSLDQIHRCGVIHRDISPDNIMVTSDGALKIIDFGAARQIAPDESQYTAIAKACYTPVEQYDKNGRQGPWTDVYSLCATLYYCATGAPPESAIQRMFLDELQTPTQKGVTIKPEYEAIIMKGLQVDAAKRYQSMEALASALRKVLPQQSPASQNERKKLILSFAAGFVFLAILVGAWLYTKSVSSDKFRGVETESIQITAATDMTAKEFADAQENVHNWLEDFAGHDNYIMSVDGTHINVTVPLSIYEGQEINQTTTESYNSFTNFDKSKDKAMELVTEIKANWEDPARSLIAGNNQVLPDTFHEDTLIFIYSWTAKLTPGQRANALVDFKTRLDALDVPYAFGTLYGNDNAMVFCLSPNHIGRVILDMLGSECLYLAGECKHAKGIFLSYYDFSGVSEIQPLSSDDGYYGFRYERRNETNKDLESLTQILLQNGESKVYLRTDNGFNLGEVEINTPIQEGYLDIIKSCVDVSDPADAQHAWLYQFVDSVLNHTNLPDKCHLRASAVRSADGSPRFDVKPEDCYGIHTSVTDGEAAFRDTLIRIGEEEGLRVTRGFNDYVETYYCIYLNLETDDSLAENLTRVLSSLIQKYDLKNQRMDPTVYIMPVDEREKKRCRITLNSTYDYDTGEIKPMIEALFYNANRDDKVSQALLAWWDGFDAEALGYRKGYY